MCNCRLWNRWLRGSGQWPWISDAAKEKLINRGLSYSSIHLPTCNRKEKRSACVCVRVCACVSVWADNNLPLKALPLPQQNRQDEGDQSEGPLCPRPLEMTSEIKTHWWATHHCLHCRPTWELRTERQQRGRVERWRKTHISPALNLENTKYLASEVLCFEPQNFVVLIDYNSRTLLYWKCYSIEWIP